MSLRRKTGFTQYRGHQRIEGPDVEPVTVAEVREYLRLEDDGDDATLELLIASAREQFEAISGRALINQKWRLTLDHWPSGGGEPWWDGVKQGAVSDLVASGRPGRLTLPVYRLQSVDSIATDGKAIDVDKFIVDTEQEPGRLVPKAGATWPVALQRANAIVIEYTAGYGAAPEDVPAALRLGILQFVAYLYENRGDCPAEEAMRKSGAAASFNRYTVARL